MPKSVANVLGQPSPIHGLPTETLVEIFCHLSHLGSLPWVLFQVCWRWYSIAVNTPYLFSLIQVTDAWHWNLGGYHTCSQLKTLEALLERANNHPLRIKVRYTYDDEFLQTEELNYQYILVIKAIFGDLNGVSKRIVHLQLDQHSYRMFTYLGLSNKAPGDPALKHITHRTNSGFSYQDLAIGPLAPLPSLRSIDIRERCHPDFIVHLAGTSIHLEEIIIRDNKVVSEVWATSGIMKRVRRFTLPTILSYPRHEPFLSSFLSPSHFASLIELDTRQMEWPLPTTLEFTLPYLRRLEVHCHDLIYLSRLELPILAFLNVERRIGDREHLGHLRDVIASPSRIHFPELSTLELRGSTLYWLMLFKTPKLKSLLVDIKACHYDGIISVLPRGESLNGSQQADGIGNGSNPFLLYSFPYFVCVRELVLIRHSTPTRSTIGMCGGGDHRLIIHLLQCLPSATCAQFLNKDLSDSAFDMAILNQLIGVTHYKPLLPDLEQLTIGGPRHPSRSHRSDIITAVKCLLEMRKERQMSLKSVTAYCWSDIGTASVWEFP